jgi:hypothetical protein
MVMNRENRADTTEPWPLGQVERGAFTLSTAKPPPRREDFLSSMLMSSEVNKRQVDVCLSRHKHDAWTFTDYNVQVHRAT